MTDDQIAAKLGVSRMTWLRYISGTADIRLDFLTKAAEISGRPIGWFFDEIKDDGAPAPNILVKPIPALVSEPQARYESNATMIGGASGPISIDGLLAFTLDQLADEADRLQGCGHIGSKLRELRSAIQKK